MTRRFSASIEVRELDDDGSEKGGHSVDIIIEAEYFLDLMFRLDDETYGISRSMWEEEGGQ